MSSIWVDGITIRPLRGGDEATVRTVFDALGPESRRLRFGSAKADLTAADLARLARVDGRHHVLVAHADGVPVAIARLVRDADVPTTAEVALAVADVWQRRGVGTILIERLAADARAAGVTHLRASMRAEERAPLALMQRVIRIERSRVVAGEREVDGRAA
jgi:acetyltransferase